MTAAPVIPIDTPLMREHLAQSEIGERSGGPVHIGVLAQRILDRAAEQMKQRKAE